MAKEDHRQLAKEYRAGKHNFKHPSNAIKFAEMHERSAKSSHEKALGNVLKGKNIEGKKKTCFECGKDTPHLNKNKKCNECNQ